MWYNWNRDQNRTCQKHWICADNEKYMNITRHRTVGLGTLIAPLNRSLLVFFQKQIQQRFSSFWFTGGQGKPIVHFIALTNPAVWFAHTPNPFWLWNTEFLIGPSHKKFKSLVHFDSQRAVVNQAKFISLLWQIQQFGSFNTPPLLFKNSVHIHTGQVWPTIVMAPIEPQKCEHVHHSQWTNQYVHTNKCQRWQSALRQRNKGIWSHLAAQNCVRRRRRSLINDGCRSLPSPGAAGGDWQHITLSNLIEWDEYAPNKDPGLSLIMSILSRVWFVTKRKTMSPCPNDVPLRNRQKVSKFNKQEREGVQWKFNKSQFWDSVGASQLQHPNLNVPFIFVALNRWVSLFLLSQLHWGSNNNFTWRWVRKTPCIPHPVFVCPVYGDSTSPKFSGKSCER